MKRQPESLSAILTPESPSRFEIDETNEIRSAYLSSLHVAPACPECTISNTDHERRQKLLIVETISSVCWFLMDATWMFGLVPLTLAMAVLTILSNLAVFRYAEKSLSYYLITAAMTFWAAMNVCWMLTDIKVWKGGLPLAAVFFGLGTICLVAAFVTAKNKGDTLVDVAKRFRRLLLRKEDE